MLQTVLSSTANELVNALADCGVVKNNVTKVIMETMNDAQNPFAGLDTNFKQLSYIKKNFNYAGYSEEVLGEKLERVRRKNKRVLISKDEKFIYIPLLDSLAQLLSHKKIAKLILRMPKYCGDGILYDICDREFFKNDDLFRENEDALIIILYHDALEVCNPLGSHAGTHKLDMFYYTLGNLDPKVRSKRCAIRLLAIVKSNLVKK